MKQPDQIPNFRSKQEIRNFIGVSRTTFNKKYVPQIISYLNISYQDWKNLHSQTFSVELSEKIKAYFVQVRKPSQRPIL